MNPSGGESHWSNYEIIKLPCSENEDMMIFQGIFLVLYKSILNIKCLIKKNDHVVTGI